MRFQTFLKQITQRLYESRALCVYLPNNFVKVYEECRNFGKLSKNMTSNIYSETIKHYDKWYDYNKLYCLGRAKTSFQAWKTIENNILNTWDFDAFGIKVISETPFEI